MPSFWNIICNFALYSWNCIYDSGFDSNYDSGACGGNCAYGYAAPPAIPKYIELMAIAGANLLKGICQRKISKI